MTRRLVKDAQHMMNGGDFKRAQILLGSAYGETRDYGEPTDSATLSPRIRHRLAQVTARFEGPEEAGKHFELAESLFDRRNVIGRAITLRDYGWTLWQNGEFRNGITRLEAAASLFRPKSSQDTRHEIERVVTEGMLARTYLHDPSRTLEIQMHVDEIVSGGRKLIYELDNLREMVVLLSGKDYLRVRARTLRLEALIAAKNELLYLGQDLSTGDVVSAVTGPAVRTLGRLSPFS